MPMPVLPRGEPSEAVSVALVVAAVGLLFLPLSFITYALYDDYAYMAIHAYRGQNPFFMGDGRPIGGAIAVALFSIFDRVELGGWLRLIALVELLAALVLLHRAAIVSGLRPLWAGAFAIGVATMPSMQNWVVWGVSAWELPALVLSIGSFFAWRGFSEAGQPHQRRAVVLFVLMSLVSLLIYQPFATAVWPLIFIDIVLRRDVKANLRPLLVAVVSYVLAIVVFYAMFKGMAAAFVPDAGHNRTKLIAVADLPGRIRAFLAFPVAAALSPFRTHPHLGLAAAMLALILAGLYRVAPRRLDLAGNIVFLLAAAVIAHSPSLLSSEPTGLRTNVVISLLALGALCLALQSLLAGGRLHYDHGDGRAAGDRARGGRPAAHRDEAARQRHAAAHRRPLRHFAGQQRLRPLRRDRLRQQHLSMGPAQHGAAVDARARRRSSPLPYPVRPGARNGERGLLRGGLDHGRAGARRRDHDRFRPRPARDRGVKQAGPEGALSQAGRR
jgi:hypothetical protein